MNKFYLLFVLAIFLFLITASKGEAPIFIGFNQKFQYKEITKDQMPCTQGVQPHESGSH